jgi:molybdenum cofactor cytidylyltransferase
MEGADKLLLPIGGRPLIRLPVEAAVAADLSPLAVVVRPDARLEAALEGLPVERLENPAVGRGLSGSVEIGLAWASARAEAALLLLGDEPGISPSVIRLALEAWRDRRPAVARIRYADRPGHPVIVRLPLPPDALPTGDVGLRDLVARADEIPVTEEAPIDVDTEADYREALARLPR